MIKAKVVRGDGLGKKYGYPTANLDLAKDEIEHEGGVYAGYGYFEEKKYPAAIVFQKDPWKAEVHLIDFQGDLYEKDLEIEVIQKINDLKKIDEEDMMAGKIKGDIDLIKKTLNK